MITSASSAHQHWVAGETAGERGAWNKASDAYRGVLEWMIGRVKGEANAVETPIGFLPADADLNLDGVTLSDEAKQKLFGFDHAGWQAEIASIGEYLDEYGPRMPQALKDEQARIASALS